MIRPESPDTVCPICLDGIKNRCQPNSCLHGFCFECLETTVRRFVMLEIYAIRAIMEVRVNRHIVRLLVEFVLNNMINLNVDRMAEFLSPFLGRNSLQFVYELKGFLAHNRSEAEDRDSVPGANGAEPTVDVPSPEMNDFVPATPSANLSASSTVGTSAGSTVSTSASSIASTSASSTASSSAIS